MRKLKCRLEWRPNKTRRSNIDGQSKGRLKVFLRCLHRALFWFGQSVSFICDFDSTILNFSTVIVTWSVILFQPLPFLIRNPIIPIELLFYSLAILTGPIYLFLSSSTGPPNLFKRLLWLGRLFFSTIIKADLIIISILYASIIQDMKSWELVKRSHIFILISHYVYFTLKLFDRFFRYLNKNDLRKYLKRANALAVGKKGSYSNIH